MTSKALKTAIATAMLTGTDAWPMPSFEMPSFNTPDPEQEAIDKHNMKVSQRRKSFAEKTLKADMKKKQNKTLKKRQKLMQETMRHIKDDEGARETLANAYISEALPIPIRLKRGDIVRYKGVGNRPGPWTDGVKNPSSEVEIVEVIKPSLGPPQYLVANVSAPGEAPGPGGPTILVNEDQLESAPLGRKTLGFLEEWDKLDKVIAGSPKYNPDYYKGALLPGARTSRDADELLKDNPDFVVGPAWRDQRNLMYNSELEKQQKKLATLNKQIKQAQKERATAIDNYKPETYIGKAMDTLAPYIGKTAARTAVAAPLGAATWALPGVVLPLALADEKLGRSKKATYMRDMRNKMAEEQKTLRKEEAKMKKLYHKLHSVNRGKTSVYPSRKFETDFAIPTLSLRHTQKLQRQDKERIAAEKKKREEEKIKELKKQVEADVLEDDKDEEAEEEAQEEVAPLLINDDVPEEDLLRELRDVIARYEDYYEAEDDDEIKIDGKDPEWRLRALLQEKINDHNKKKKWTAMLSEIIPQGVGDTTASDANEKLIIGYNKKKLTEAFADDESGEKGKEEGGEEAAREAGKEIARILKIDYVSEEDLKRDIHSILRKFDDEKRKKMVMAAKTIAKKDGVASGRRRTRRRRTRRRRTRRRSSRKRKNKNTLRHIGKRRRKAATSRKAIKAIRN